jgi:PilZ domain
MDMSGKPKIGSHDAVASDGMRNAARESLFLLGRLFLTETSDPIDVRIRNLSATGMMVDSRLFGELGQTVHIELKNIGKVPGKIAWVAEKRMGIALINAIDPILARQPVGQSPSAPSYVKPSETRRPGLKIL